MAEESVKTISVKDLVRKVLNHEELFILDVRNTDDFDDWKIEGKNIHIINAPYFDLLEGVDSIRDKLPSDQEIYVICAKGGSSEFVAEQIAEAGFSNVYSIEGGMKAWSEHLEPIKVGDLKNGGEIYQFVRIGKGCLSYLVVSDGKGAMIDTNRMLNPYEEFISEKNITLTHIFDTHLHADHISGGRKLAEKHGADYYLPPKDAEEVQFEYNHIHDGDEYTVGKATLKAIYTPGHTIGSTSFVVDDQYLLTGDILFIDSIGRPDLAGKAGDWVKDLRTTLYERYKELTDDLIVLPAHFMTAKEMNDDGSVAEKLGVLYQQNHGLNIDSEEEFRKTVTENLPPQPNSYQEIRETNMGKISPEEEQQREMEIGPNRCAVR
ncbi:MBL fold metallo-hydrolase [Bacillus thermotolerans]|uniref:Zn-dependent hydroxyacylglutathione hydrolase n=1 Tax=Bacillus thermotolerans TaxID=1221996 RepID=A0A0F5HL52_BACTR|nr:MBL fold metallo-hydrolase [Bacillus thermotolerans]KKB33547.1 Zn-dependent hydroxyacylglutathione hydrolase [Bacillus thermotolerans]KKB33714.1 Zn-dependent hydroxyacylglutathione hydrolase [Bacillus thermotolerans]KKB35808.1 Zn-dependent hydroxyacylglutathione hydrolase [Bacillus thermotolerans]